MTALLAITALSASVAAGAQLAAGSVPAAALFLVVALALAADIQRRSQQSAWSQPSWRDRLEELLHGR